MKKKIVFLTGAGISAESGLSTYRDSDGLWEQVDVNTVATHKAWQVNPSYVNAFYNKLRVKYQNAEPNDGHKLIAELEKDYDVVVITQNVDNLHEKGGSTNVIHLHGNAMIMCSEDDVENREYWVQLPYKGWGESGLEVPENELAGDGSLLRPYIVFFDEPVPNIEKALAEIMTADIIVVVGTSLNVYPAAGLINYADVLTPVYIIDPGTIQEVDSDNFYMEGERPNFIHIKEGGSVGMRKLIDSYLS